MKLLSCHVDNFGKLSNLTLNFTDGINVINEANAWGKSTLAAFLKAMFYGLDAKKDPKAFAVYDTFAEECKVAARQEVYGEEASE